MPQYFFSLDLWQNPLRHEGSESELGKLKSAMADAALRTLFASFIR
jgi:hypothetical protein